MVTVIRINIDDNKRSRSLLPKWSSKRPMILIIHQYFSDLIVFVSSLHPYILSSFLAISQPHNNNSCQCQDLRTMKFSTASTTSIIYLPCQLLSLPYLICMCSPQNKVMIWNALWAFVKAYSSWTYIKRME